MRAKIHTLQVEIKTIENMLGSLNGAMLQMAMDEVKNLRFELDMLNRKAMKANSAQVLAASQVEEAGVYA